MCIVSRMPRGRAGVQRDAEENQEISYFDSLIRHRISPSRIRFKIISIVGLGLIGICQHVAPLCILLVLEYA